MFNKKSKEIQKLKKEIKESKTAQKDLTTDFIIILEHIQKINNENLQWKKRQSTINNNIDLVLERCRNIVKELD